MAHTDLALSESLSNDHQTQTPEDMNATNERVDEGDENVERGNWSSKTDYLLSMIGCAVGLGNVWRFPYLAYRNGGGVFLIPYSLMLALVAMPMVFLECSFGQFASLGPIGVWKAVPMLQDPLCNLAQVDGYFEIVNATWLQTNNETCPNGSEIFMPHQGPSEQYWDKVVLRRSSSMDETGEIVWYLALCLLLTWLITGAALSRGIKSSGKVVYFTATFPYVVLTILLIRGVTLVGAYKGIEFYIGSHSNFSKLADIEVWKDAATQIFFSLAVGRGSLITLSSYNKFHNNCYRDTIVVCVVSCATSVFSGFVIFSILGHMTHVQDKPVSEIAASGFGLTFIAYPEALAQLPWAPLWSILFFFMLFILDVDTQLADVETIFTILLDQFPTFRQSRRHYLTAAVCLLFYFLGLAFVTQAGIYRIDLVDHFCSGWIVIVTALLELIGLSWIYGINQFIKDIEMMIGKRSWLFWLWWRACWFLISPCLLEKISAARTSAPDWGPYLEQHRGERYSKKPDSTEGPNCLHLLASPQI